MDSDGMEVPPANQPRASDYAFDLDHVLSSVVGLHSIIPNDAFSADNLGTERAGREHYSRRFSNLRREALLAMR
jgi:hypothetical protein